MGFLDSLLSGVVGFATGGPIVGGATFLAGLLGDGRSSGGQQGALRQNADIDYLDVMQRQAALNGYMAGLGQNQGGSNQGQPQGTGSGVSATRTPTGLSQFANQRGGQSIGGSLSQGSSAQRNIAGQEAGNVNIGQLYNSFIAQGLLGQGTLPQSNAQMNLASGQATINAQAQQSQRQLLEQLSQRGILRSGITGTGLATIEQGRLNALGGLEQQRQQQLLQTQQFAAQLASGNLQQQRAIEANEPSFGETLASLAGAYAQYEATKKAPQPTTQILMPGLLGGAGAATPTTTPMLAGTPITPYAGGPTTEDYVNNALGGLPRAASPAANRAWWQWYD